MSDPAQKAWNKWQDFRKGDQFYDRPSPMFRDAFAAGQVDALEQAAEAFRNSPRFHDKDGVVSGLLRDMATQLRNATP